MNAKVWLVGAGPGDPELLTLKAVKALQQADIVMIDDLVNPAVLEHCPGARIVSVGKRGGCRSTPQAFIHRLMLRYARQGKCVVRLKGGDPFVFGRGGEEALTLVEHNVPFRVIPGITAGIGGLAYAGIPVTHRDRNHAVTFMTGHSASGLVPDTIDWTAVARGSPVIIMYMALKHLALIADRFMEAGRPRDQAVAIVTNATLPNQHVLETTLERAASDVAEHGIEPPAMVVVGDVVLLRPALDWLGALSGRVLTTSGVAG